MVAPELLWNLLTPFILFHELLCYENFNEHDEQTDALEPVYEGDIQMKYAFH
jgi:hypothetical protein